MKSRYREFQNCSFRNEFPSIPHLPSNCETAHDRHASKSSPRVNGVALPHLPMGPYFCGELHRLLWVNSLTNVCPHESLILALLDARAEGTYAGFFPTTDSSWLITDEITPYINFPLNCSHSSQSLFICAYEQQIESESPDEVMASIIRSTEGVSLFMWTDTQENTSLVICGVSGIADPWQYQIIWKRIADNVD